MKKTRTSYAFLMEMMWVCGFFAVAACIFVLAFVKADHLSKSAENLNHAVLLAQNAVETCLSDYETQDDTFSQGRADDSAGDASRNVADDTFYDRSWRPVETAETAVYTLSVSSREEEGLFLVTAAVSGKDGETIYRLEGSRFQAAERRRP